MCVGSYAFGNLPQHATKREMAQGGHGDTLSVALRKQLSRSRRKRGRRKHESLGCERLAAASRDCLRKAQHFSFARMTGAKTMSSSSNSKLMCNARSARSTSGPSKCSLAIVATYSFSWKIARGYAFAAQET